MGLFAGFMTTEEGRRQYLLNIQQIAQSVQETNNYDVLSALLHVREYEREWERRHSMIRTPWNDLGKREVMEFGIVQKDFRGFEILHEKYKHRLNRYGVTPSMWVFPPGLALYAAFDPLVTEYNKEARGATLNTGPEVLGSFRGLNVFETREFDVRQGELPINLLQRRVQIGEHYYMRNHHSDNTKYKTNLSMDIVVYNEDRDDWEKISFRDAINHSHRFKAGGELNTDDFKLDPPAHDLFTYKSTDYTYDTRHQWCDIFGQMEDDHLPAEALRAFCESAEAAYKKSKGVATIDVTGFPGFPGAATFKEDDPSGANMLISGVTTAAAPPATVPGKPTSSISGLCEYVFGEKAMMLRPHEILIGRPRLFTFVDELMNTTGNSKKSLLKLPQKVQVAIADMLKANKPVGSTEEVFGASMISAIELYLRDNTITLKEVPTLLDSARFQEILNASAVGKIPKASDKFLNHGVIHAENKDANKTKYVFLDHEWLQVGDPKNRGRLLELCQPMSALNVDIERIVKARGTMLPGFEKNIAIGSKRSMAPPPRAWKRRGLSDFTAQFAPVGARGGMFGQDSYNYVADDADNADDLDYSTMTQGLKVNDKHLRFAEKIATLATDAQMVIARCLYYTMVRGEVVQSWMNKDIVLPFSVIVARPFMTYDMCTCIMMKGGSETGSTYQGHSDFQLGDDVQSKIHYGNYTYYSKAIVTNHKNIIIARNVLANGYVGGDGTSWRDPITQKGDMCAFVVPYNEHKKSNPLRVFSVDRENKQQSMTGALFYSRIYNQAALPADAKFSTLSEQEDSNEITYMGHHFWWKPHREQTAGTAGSYTGVTVNTGHWGPKVYPGCGRVRAGDEVYLKDIDYGQEVF
jgi:hypothetical protein